MLWSPRRLKIDFLVALIVLTIYSAYRGLQWLLG